MNECSECDALATRPPSHQYSAHPWDRG